jgi:predicted alpha/beta-fold hydrolase
MEDIARILPFEPPPWLRNRHVQSVLPSLPLRRPATERAARELVAASRPLLLDCGEGVRLLGLHATQEGLGRPPSRRLLVLHHGWEGSAESLYILSLGQAALEAGFDVLRLNLRDHGPTGHQLFLVGFSLGGNFALRVGARAGAAGLAIRKIVAVCPVLDPAVTLEALESGPALYREYFILKWRRSLAKKQAAWPDEYDFGDLVRERSLTGMTARMVEKYTEFPDLHAYLSGYAITGEALATLEVESRIITSMDDPMILPGELRKLWPAPALTISLSRYGGHCGFVERLRGCTWIDREILGELQRA